MSDELYPRSRSHSARGGISTRAALITTLLAFAGGASLVGWLVWDGRISVSRDVSAPSSVVGTSTVAKLPSPGNFSPSTQAAEAAGAYEQRIAAMEQRLARLDLQAAAAEGNTARAEGLLVAFAARRALERGAPLGYLEDQLKLRFGDAQPNAVRTVIDTAKQPVTLDQLSMQLAGLGDQLAAAPRNESGWDRVKRELSGLFVIRHESSPSTQPLDRLERAKLLLRTCQVDEAANEIERMPGAAAAGQWVAAARRYAATQRALDLIETAALLDTEKLKSGSGQAVTQPSPLAPSPSATPS